jgi:opacity protein-like surface antigen
MKTLVKITAICALVLISFTANSQIKVGVSGGIAMPMGDFGDLCKMGFGGGVTGKYMLNETMAVGASIGYQMFGPKEELPSGYDFKLAIMPIVGNFTYYFGTEGFKPYAGIDAGFFMAKTTIKIAGVEGSESSSDMGFAPTVGFEYGLSDKLALDVNAKYNYIMTEGTATTYLGVNVGVLMSLGE